MDPHGAEEADAHVEEVISAMEETLDHLEHSYEAKDDQKHARVVGHISELLKGLRRVTLCYRIYQ